MGKQNISSWKIPLEGHSHDLEDLPFWFAKYDVQVAPHNEGYALTIPFEINGDNYEQIRSHAESQLQLINGIGRLLNSQFRPISLSRNIFGVNNLGNVITTLFAGDTASGRAKAATAQFIVRGKAQIDPRERAASPLLKAANLSQKAHDALIIVGRPTLTWSELYLLFELVQSDFGSKMEHYGWISKEKANLFSHTANSYSVLRHNGRHGKDRGDPPSKPMQYGEAVTLITNLILHWLQHIGTDPCEN